jgi:large subunit ribosomal protein L17
MRHAKRGRKLGRDSAHRRAMLATMAGQVIQHGRIKTTQPKAKEIRGLVDRLVTIAKRTTSMRGARRPRFSRTRPS